MALMVEKVEFVTANVEGHPEHGRFHFVLSGPSTAQVDATFYARQFTKGGGLGMAESGARGNILGYLKALVAQIEEQALAEQTAN